jgi:hypothetical protein
MSTMLAKTDNATLITVADDDSSAAGPGANIRIEEAKQRGKAAQKPRRERKGPGGNQTEKAKRWTAGQNYPRNTGNTDEATRSIELSGIDSTVQADLQSLQLSLDMTTGQYDDVLRWFIKELKDADAPAYHVLRQPLEDSYSFFVEKKKWEKDGALSFLRRKIEEIGELLAAYAPVLRERHAKDREQREQEQEFEPMWLYLLQRRLLRMAAELGKESHFTEWLRQQDARSFNALTKPVGDSVEYLMNRYEDMNEWRALRSVRLALTRVQEQHLPAFQAELQELQVWWDKTHELVQQYKVVMKSKITGITAKLFYSPSMTDALKRFTLQDVRRTLEYVDGQLEKSTQAFVTTQPRKGNSRAEGKKKARAEADRELRNRMRGGSKKKGGEN